MRDTFARSRDGTTISVTLIHLPGALATTAPFARTHGYGSYGIPQLPGYSSLVATWVRLGGVYAVGATVRVEEYPLSPITFRRGFG